MRIRSWSLLTLVLSTLALPALAPSSPQIRFARCWRPAAFLALSIRRSISSYSRSAYLRWSVCYSGPNSMLYVFSGTLAAQLDGTGQTISEGGGVFIPAGHAAIFGATGAAPARFLQFILEPAAEAEKPPLGGPPRLRRCICTLEPLPGLRPGPYEFSLTRTTLPAGMPVNPPHYRSGAALYHISSLAPGPSRRMGRPSRGQQARCTSSPTAGLTNGQTPATPRSSFSRRISARRAFRRSSPVSRNSGQPLVDHNVGALHQGE